MLAPSRCIPVVCILAHMYSPDLESVLHSWYVTCPLLSLTGPEQNGPGHRNITCPFTCWNASKLNGYCPMHSETVINAARKRELQWNLVNPKVWDQRVFRLVKCLD